MASANSVTGSWIIPLSERFTLRTSAACSAIVMFLCNIPIPPACAIAIAKSAPVTVSIAAETNGIFNLIFFVSEVLVSTSRGKISE
ncbi:hypothetical protein D3C81_1814480 [compost metagenome]